MFLEQSPPTQPGGVRSRSRSRSPATPWPAAGGTAKIPVSFALSVGRRSQAPLLLHMQNSGSLVEIIGSGTLHVQAWVGHLLQVGTQHRARGTWKDERTGEHLKPQLDRTVHYGQLSVPKRLELSASAAKPKRSHRGCSQGLPSLRPDTAVYFPATGCL